MKALTKEQLAILIDCGMGVCERETNADFDGTDYAADVEFPDNVEEILNELVERGLVVRYLCHACTYFDREEVEHGVLTARGTTALAFYRAHPELVIEKKA